MKIAVEKLLSSRSNDKEVDLLTYGRKEKYAPKQITPLYLVLVKLDELSRNLGGNLHFLIDAIRAEWINSLPKEEKKEFLQVCEALGVDVPKPNKKLYQIAVRYGLTKEDWRYDENFVFKYRFHLPVRGIYQPHLAPAYDLFFRLFGKFYKGKKKEIKKVLENYDLSIRPINLCSSIVKSEAIKNFLPETGQKFSKDPFGVQRLEHLVLDKIGGKLVYLSTRKKEHGTYLSILNVVAYCTAGCARCYRGEQTRELKTFTAINPDGSEKNRLFFTAFRTNKKIG